MTKIHGWVAVLAMAGSSAALATPISGPSLQNAITALGGVVDVQNQQAAPDEQFQIGATGVAAARIQFEMSAYADANIFGIYDIYDPATRITIFSGSDGAGTFGFLFNPTADTYCTATLATILTPTCAVFGTDRFGFFLNTPTGDTYFSEKSINQDGVDHMVAFQGGPTRGNIGLNPWLSNEYLLAWEDTYGGGDRDYNDFVVMVESVIGVPEPSSIAIFGAGLFAIGMFARRRVRNVTGASTRRS